MYNKARKVIKQSIKPIYPGEKYLQHYKIVFCPLFSLVIQQMGSPLTIVKEQAGTELGQAQLKLGLDFTLIFCRFDFSPFELIELV